ncbi:MAG: hypothetical protein AAGI88_09815 [Pseudomonadota bacterium]
MNDRTQLVMLRLVAILWIVWGIVHALAGMLTIAGSTADGFQAIADGVPAAELVGEYHPAVGAVLNQHGWNLLWGGGVTIAGGILIWRQDNTAIWVTAMVGGLLELGYLVFLDLGGFVNLVPGTVMTLVSASAIALSGWECLFGKAEQCLALRRYRGAR